MDNSPFLQQRSASGSRVTQKTLPIYADSFDSGMDKVGATFTILKAMLGPGILYSPYGFEEGGVIFAFFMIGLAYGLFAWSALSLLACWRENRNLDYSAMMSLALEDHPLGRAIIDSVTVFQQCGICLTYFIFVARNMQDIALLVGMRLHLSTLCALQLLCYWPLTTISSIQRLQKTSIIGNCLVMYCLTVFLVFAASSLITEGTALNTADNSAASTAQHWLLNRTSFYLFIGTSCFMFEGSVANILSVQNAMRDELKASFPEILMRTVGAYVTFVAFFGFVNWIALGDFTNINLTLNLPSGFWKSTVQVAYSIAVCLSFPLQVFPAIHTIHRLLAARIVACRKMLKNVAFNDNVELNPESRKFSWMRIIDETSDRTVISTLLCVLLLMIAIGAVDHLPGLVSFVGALFGIPYCFCFPSFIHLRLLPNSPIWVKYVNVIVMTSGLALSVVCSSLSAWSIISANAR